MNWMISWDGPDAISTSVETDIKGSIERFLLHGLLQLYNDNEPAYDASEFMDCNNYIRHEVCIARPQKGADRIDLEWISYEFRLIVEEREDAPGYRVRPCTAHGILAGY